MVSITGITTGHLLGSGVHRQRSDSDPIVVEHHDGARFEVGLDRRKVHEEQSRDLACASLALTPEEHDRWR